MRRRDPYKVQKTYDGYRYDKQGKPDYSKVVGWTGANHQQSTQTGKDINWELMSARLPTKKTKEDKIRRKKLFKDFDPNGNGYLSLAEIDKGVRDVLAIPQLFDVKPALIRAYYASKDKAKAKTKYSDDYVTLSEFRYLLLSLRMYFEYWAAFARVDTNDDRRISRQEFVQGQRTMERWVGPIMDINKEFDIANSDGGKMILFEEFCGWAITKGLDLEDDDDYDQDNFAG